MPARKRKAGAILPFFDYWWFKTTPAGKAMAVCLIVSGFTAMLSLEIPVYELLVALSVFVLVVYAASWLARPKLEARWRLPEKAVAGQPLEIACGVTNRSWFWAREIGVGAYGLAPSLKNLGPSGAASAVAPGKTGEISFSLLPLKRGIYAWPRLNVFTLFPFGLFRTRVRSVYGSNGSGRGGLVVYPNFRPLTSINVPISARYQPGGIALSSSVGESPEYIGNREYRPGDSTRHLDHRSWARLATPAVREYQEEYYCRVGLLLDTFVSDKRRPGPEGYPQLEGAVSLTAAVAHALALGEYIIDIFAAGPELYVFRAGRSHAHFENILEILACVGACRSNPFRKITPAVTDELGSISSLICVFLDWDKEREAIVRAAAEAGCSVKVVIVRDGEPTLPCRSDEMSGTTARYAPQAILAGGVDSL